MDIFDLSTLYGAVLGAVGVLRYKNLDNRRQLFVVFQGINMLTSIAAIILAKQYINNHWTLHVSSALRYGFFAFLLSFWITAPATKKYIRYSIPVFLLVWLSLELTVENIRMFSVYSRPLEGILLIIVSMITLETLNRETTVPLLKNPGMWFSSGILIYSSGVTILILLSNSMLSTSYSLVLQAWHIQVACAFIANTMYIVALLLPDRELQLYPDNSTGRR